MVIFKELDLLRQEVSMNGQTHAVSKVGLISPRGAHHRGLLHDAGEASAHFDGETSHEQHVIKKEGNITGGILRKGENKEINQRLCASRRMS